MSDLNVIMSGLKAEIENQIESLEPNRPVDLRFRFERFSVDSQNKTIFDATCDPRCFQIGSFSSEGTFAIGGNNRSGLYDLEIMFSYPTNDAWESAANDDMLSIDHYFLKNPSTVDGVCGRWANIEKPYRSDPSTDDARTIYTLTLRCHLETSF